MTGLSGVAVVDIVLLDSRPVDPVAALFADVWPDVPGGAGEPGRRGKPRRAGRSGPVREVPEATVREALAAYPVDLAADQVRAAGRLLDKVGFTGCADRSVMTRFGTFAGRSVTDLLGSGEAGAGALGCEVLRRLAGADPDGPVSPMWERFLMWAGSSLGSAAVRALPEGSGPLLARVAEMPLLARQDHTATGLRADLVTRADCPPQVLALACANWPLAVAAAASRHPACPEEAAVMFALRAG